MFLIMKVIKKWWSLIYHSYSQIIWGRNINLAYSNLLAFEAKLGSYRLYFCWSLSSFDLQPQLQKKNAVAWSNQ